MKEFLKKFFKPFMFLVFSIYFLSIPIFDRPLYFYARKVFVENQLVNLVCEHSTALYNQVSEKFRLAIVESAAPKEKTTK